MSTDPKTYCDEECAMFNQCVVGGIECNRCGGYFCSMEIDEAGLCVKCSKLKEREDQMKMEFTPYEMSEIIERHERRINMLSKMNKIRWRAVVIVLLANPIIAMLVAALVMKLLGMEAE